MKERYEEAAIEVIEFRTSDVIRTSGYSEEESCLPEEEEI